MAYIPWYDRLKPVTLGERFGLNEISTARNTLSPTNSHTIDRIDMKPGGLVEPGVTHYGDSAVKKLKNPPDPKKPWRYLRTGNPRKVGGAKRITQYFATEQEALAAQVEARKIKYEAATKVPKSDFNKIKQRIIKGETLEQIAKTYKSTTKPIVKLLYDNNTNYTKLTPNVSYLEDADSLKYIKENYGKLKGETLGKALYPDLPASTQQARVRKLVTKLLAQKEIKYTPAALIEEVREEQGFNPEKSTKKVQTERVAAKKKFSVPVFETAMQGSKASQLSHMGDLYNEIVRFETLGYSPQRINQEVLKNVDPYLKTLVEKRATLLKNKPPGYEAKVNEINIKGEAVARSTKGYKSFEVIEPSGKSYILGKDYAKSIDPLGHFEGKTIQEIAPEKISRRSKILEQMIPDPGERKLFIKNAKAVQKSQAKVSKAKIDKIAKDLTDLGFDTSPKVAIETAVNKYIKVLPYEEAVKIAKEVKCPIRGKNAEGGRIGFGEGSGSMLACIEAKFKDNPKTFFEKTGSVVSKGLDKIWKYASPYWFPAVVVATGRLEAFKHPTKPDMWWETWLASDAVKRWGLDKVKLSQLKNASLAQKADILGKLGLSGGALGSKILTKAAKVARPLVLFTELSEGFKAGPTKENKIAQIAKDKGWDVKETINMYRLGEVRNWDRATVFQKMFGKMPDMNLGAIPDLIKHPEYQKRVEYLKNYFKNESEYIKNKEKGDLRRAKYFMNKDSEYYVPFPTSMPKEEDVMKDSVIDKNDLATGGIASLLK